MLKTLKQKGRTLWIAFLLTSVHTAGCDAQMPPNAQCTGSGIYRNCSITSGSYVGFAIGMSRGEAFENACSLANGGRLNSHPVLYTKGERKGHPNASICELKMEALSSDRWEFIESVGFRERYIVLDFDDDELEEIVLQLRGMDP